MINLKNYKIYFLTLLLITTAGVLSYAQQELPMEIEDLLRKHQTQQGNNNQNEPPLGFPNQDPAQQQPGVDDPSLITAPPQIDMRGESVVDKAEAVIDVLELKNMDIQDFFKLIAKKSGLNIVAGPNVKGRVTIYLNDVKVRDAMRIILESNNLAYAEEDNIIKVMTAQEYELKYGQKFGHQSRTVIKQLNYANVLDMVTILNQMKSPTGKVIFDTKSNTLVLIDSNQKLKEMEALIKQVDVPIETEIFELSYANAKDVGEQINEFLTINVGRLKFDERSNRIVVTDTASSIEKIGKIIEAFDIKEQEVLIEAKIVQIILSDQHQMGVDWEAIVSDYKGLDLTGDFDILSSSDKSGQVSIGTLSREDYTFLLEALETVGETNILSNPSIAAVNNQEAKILVGSQQPYVTTTTTTPSSGPTTTAESVNFIDVGVKLFVTPTIHKDDFITMKIKPEVSTVTSNLTTSQNNTIPIVETSEAETVVTVKNGVTIVIGGLIKEERIDSFKKIPFLGDIPFLGAAFRNSDQKVTKTELVIFLSPKIVTGDVESTDPLNRYRETFTELDKE